MAEIDELRKIVETVRKATPYPDDIFIRPPMVQYAKMQELFKEAELSSDAFFGTFGRDVWNNCCDAILKEIRNRIEEAK